jgi:hypothetical protein
MRTRYIQDPNTLELVPAEEFYASREEVNAPMVMADIQPYRSMIDGTVISSRSRHREHLKANGCIEVGNDWKPQKRTVDPHAGLKQRIADIVNAKL